MNEAAFDNRAFDDGGPIDVSLIVCTRNRRAALDRLFSSVTAAAAAASDIRVGVIVVDNGSTDDTWDVAIAFAGAAPFAVAVRREPALGLANARNTGVRHARGAILAFTDDDCRLEPGFFDILVKSFRAPDAPAILGGRVLLGDSSDAAFSIKTDDEARRLDGRAHPGGFLLGCNMAIRRDVFTAVGLFDPRFGAGAPFCAAEETEFIYRAFRAGYAIEYRPSPTVWHHHGRKSLDEIRRLSFGYFVGAGAMYAKHRLGGLWLTRHLVGNLKSAAREMFGGRMFVSHLAISHRDLIGGNLVGMMRYWKHRHSAGAPRE